jgi:hypothetical protein
MRAACMLQNANMIEHRRPLSGMYNADTLEDALSISSHVAQSVLKTR